ncbi:MAG: hypothetical protein ABSE76_02985 [Minisyncoccia bacterium]|jgi:hypothetical protein
MSKEENKTERPILQFSVLCDGIATPKEMGNKPVFIGVFSSLLRPMALPQFFIVNRWISGLGEHTQIIKILDPDLKEIAKTQAQKLVLTSKVGSADVVNAFVNLNFPKAGVYWIKIELDEKTAMSYPLPVFEMK